MDTTKRTRPLTDKQRHVLEVLAAGGIIVENTGVRGFMQSVRLYRSRDLAKWAGEPVHHAVMRSLYDPHGAAFDVLRTDPALIETFKPRGAMEFHQIYYRISAKGKAALKDC